eukprot:2485677-Rhodomonas_salina.1
MADEQADFDQQKWLQNLRRLSATYQESRGYPLPVVLPPAGIQLAGSGSHVLSTVSPVNHTEVQAVPPASVPPVRTHSVRPQFVPNLPQKRPREEAPNGSSAKDQGAPASSKLARNHAGALPSPDYSINPMVIDVPANKVKYIIGVNGVVIKDLKAEAQRKGCDLMLRTDRELNQPGTVSISGPTDGVNSLRIRINAIMLSAPVGLPHQNHRPQQHQQLQSQQKQQQPLHEQQQHQPPAQPAQPTMQAANAPRGAGRAPAINAEDEIKTELIRKLISDCMGSEPKAGQTWDGFVATLKGMKQDDIRKKDKDFAEIKRQYQVSALA